MASPVKDRHSAGADPKHRLFTIGGHSCSPDLGDLTHELVEADDGMLGMGMERACRDSLANLSVTHPGKKNLPGRIGVVVTLLPTRAATRTGSVPSTTRR